MQGREEGRDPVSAARAHVKEESIPKDIEAVSYVCADAHHEVEVLKNLYDSLIDAKRSCGEQTEGLSFPKFHRLIASKADGLKQQFGCERVRFSVAVENGHVSFKAGVDRDEG
jgi:hypothetical protein